MSLHEPEVKHEEQYCAGPKKKENRKSRLKLFSILALVVLAVGFAKRLATREQLDRNNFICSWFGAFATQTVVEKCCVEKTKEGSRHTYVC